MYEASAFRRPADWQGGFAPSPYIEQTTPKTLEDDDLAYWQASVRNYFSAVSYVDFQLGRVWYKLKKSALAENTMVVILSDHGLHLGERVYFRKHTLWEQVANVPLIIHDPRDPRKQVIDDPVGLIDIGPTLLDYIGLPPLQDSPGVSLRPQIEGAKVPNRVVPTFYGQSAGMRIGPYRFIRYADGSTEMFDLARDWWQTTPLPAEHPDRAIVERRFAETCATYAFDPEAAPAEGNR